MASQSYFPQGHLPQYYMLAELGEVFDGLIMSQCFPASPQVLFTLLEKEIRLL